MPTCPNTQPTHYTPMHQQQPSLPYYQVAIVGAGISGLATAGISDIILLEKSSALRSTGAAITLFPNAWCALDALGVAHRLMDVYEPYQKWHLINLKTGSRTEFTTSGTSQRGKREVRLVHRKALLEALAEELPQGIIRFSSKLVSINIEANNGSGSLKHLLLKDKTIIKAKVVIGCDGVHSKVAQWLGIPKPVSSECLSSDPGYVIRVTCSIGSLRDSSKSFGNRIPRRSNGARDSDHVPRVRRSQLVSSGRSAIRGLSVFPEGHKFPNEYKTYVNKEIKGGFVPLNETELYWAVTHKTSTSDSQDPERILEEVTQHMAREFPFEFLAVVKHSDASTVTRVPLHLRTPWNIFLCRAHRSNVTVAGDALHPMTPNMAQGGCASLEDVIVLARNVFSGGGISEIGFVRYARERQWRTACLTGSAYLAGWVPLDGNKPILNWFVEWFVQKIFYRFVFRRIRSYAIGYDCGDLQPIVQKKSA